MSKLSDRIVREAAPPDKGSRIIWDDVVRGFGLRVTRDGTRAFILNYRTKGSGIERRITIGRYPDDYRTTSMARHRAQELRRQIAEGADPMGELREHRQAETMTELADRYIKDHCEKKNRPRTLRQNKSLVEQWVRPELGNKKVRDISRHDIEKLHSKITEGGTGTRANHVATLLGHMFALAVKWGLRADNPARGIDRNPETKRTRHLGPEELARLLKALAEHGDRDGANAIRLLLLTGARRGEVLGMRWEHVDLNAGTWTKPAASTKQGREHHVPLSAPARLLLAEIHKAARKGDNSPFVFPARNDPGSPMVNVDRLWREIAASAELPDFRLHDLRHSFASFLVSAGGSLPLIGQLLGHTQPGTTARYAHLLLDAQRAGAEVVGRIVAGNKPKSKARAPAKVVPLRRTTV